MYNHNLCAIFGGQEKGICFYAGVPNILRAVSIEQRERARQMMLGINTRQVTKIMAKFCK